MIDIKQLRIDNLLLYDRFGEQRFVKVDPDHIRMAFYFNEGFNLYYKPIPITEEWLLKFGFKKEPSYWINDSFEIKDYGDGSFRYGINFFEYGIGECFKYVHQLQNLYFAINQTELNYEF
jgi:hypothetical protein